MRKALFFIILFVSAGLCVYGQPDVLISREYRDDLYKALNAAKADSAKLPLLHKIGKYYLTKHAEDRQKIYLDSALTVFKRSVALSKAIHIDDGYGRYECLRLLGTAYLIARDTTAARHYIMQCIGYYTLKHQPEKVLQAWIKYGESCMRAHFDNLALQCFQQALPIALKNQVAADEIYLRFRIAQHLANSGNRDEAIKEYLTLIKKFEGRKQNLDKVYWMLAHYYRYKGDMKKSLAYGLAGINDVELYRDTLNTDEYYAEVAQIYEILGQTEKSIAYYRKTLHLREKLPIAEEFILRTVGFVIKGLIKLGRFNEALNEAKAYEARNPPKTAAGEAMIAQNKAYCYEALKDYPRAETYYQKMMDHYSRSGKNDEVTALAHFDIGSFYVITKQYYKAQKSMNAVSDSLPSADLYKRVELLRFKIDSGLGNYRQALVHYINYQKVKDSILNESTSKQIAELQIKYETGQKEKDIELLKRDGQLQRGRVIQANNVRNFTVAGIALLLTILILLYTSYRGNKKKSKEIDVKNTSLNQLLAEKDSLLDEKEWLIKEVHHRVKNNLQIVMGLLQRQASFINNEEALTAIQNSEHRMHSIALIHQKLYQSDSFMLVNIADYIDEMIGYLRDSFDLGERIRFEKQIANVDFEVNVAVPLGLILNEAITNAIKYAFPDYEHGCIQISLSKMDDNQYLLQIIDNGVGLPDDFNTQKADSMGFSLMRGLSKQVGGLISVVNDAGVVIKITFRPDEHGA